jgi:hypothetical protein
MNANKVNTSMKLLKHRNKNWIAQYRSEDKRSCNNHTIAKIIEVMPNPIIPYHHGVPILSLIVTRLPDSNHVLQT